MTDRQRGLHGGQQFLRLELGFGPHALCHVAESMLNGLADHLLDLHIANIDGGMLDH